MTVTKATIQGFRNIEHQEVVFDPVSNVIYGENATGKTSILESVYYAAFGKSFRSKDLDLINYDQDFCRVELEFEKNGRELEIEYGISRLQGKFFKINKKKVKSRSEIMENINIVLFCPDDLRLVKDGPMKRRIFLNREISNISKLYYSDLLEYTKIVKQRNALLKRNASDLETEIWDEKFAKKAVDVTLKRYWYVDILKEISADIHKKISGEKEHLEIAYHSSIMNEQERFIEREKLEDAVKIRLGKKLNQDRKRGFTSIGPHTDDFSIFINGKEAKTFASQGQQRTAALSLKLAEVQLIKKETSHYPIVLLDDILSELDDRRKKELETVFEHAQIIMTDTNNVGRGLKICVEKGKIIKAERNE